MKPQTKAWSFSLLLLSLVVSLQAASPAHRWVQENYPNEVNSNIITATLTPMVEVPEFMAIVVQDGEEDFAGWDEDPEAAMKKAWDEALSGVNKPSSGLRDDPFAQAKWMPFNTNVVIDLGPGDGERQVLFSYRYKGQTRSDGSSGGGVTVRTVQPTISILNPASTVTHLPIIQIQGMGSRSSMTILYDHYGPDGQIVESNADALFGTFMGDTRPGASSSRYFTCFDVELERGTNSFVFRFEDDAGNTGTTNFIIVFSTEGDQTPPHLQPSWPTAGMELTGKQFTARGKCDDDNAELEGIVIANSVTNKFHGMVERNGTYWCENIPLSLGENKLCFTATDAAGNSSSTNLVVYGAEGPEVQFGSIDPEKLWDPFISLQGTVQPADCDVWINGVQARVKPDGTWRADKVPVTGGGTATFDATALLKGTAKVMAKTKDIVSSLASLGTNAMVLNAASPSCGQFQLHMSNAGGLSFVLYASTNLQAWTPLLTNLNPAASFDYTEDVTNHVCRFFKVVPLN